MEQMSQLWGALSFDRILARSLDAEMSPLPITVEWIMSFAPNHTVRPHHDHLNYNIKNMSDSLPPPLPPDPSQHNADDQSGVTASGRGPNVTYNFVADKVGLVPNIRKKDNLYQAATVGVFLIIGAIVGWFVGGWPVGVLLGALGGLVTGTLISGFVLMIVGLCRKS
jgi:hypothetical protein